MKFHGALALLIPVLWTAHTLAAVFVVGVTNTSFGKHKIAGGFEPSDTWVVLITAHAVLACVALLSGSFAVRTANPPMRRRQFHRISGRIYVLSVIGSGALSMPLIPVASGGLLGQASLALLLACWLFSTCWAVRAIRNKHVLEHQRWMTRSYALTFANLALHVVNLMLEFTHQLKYETEPWPKAPKHIKDLVLDINEQPGIPAP